MFTKAKEFVAGKLVNHSLWNLAGAGIPLVAALVSVPILIKALGESRYGFVSIAWMLIGYFSLFDMGLGRAMTYGIAKRMAEGRDSSTIFWTGLITTCAIGVTLAAVLTMSSTWLIYHVIEIPDELKEEAFEALQVIAVSLPFVMACVGISALLEAHQKFKLLNCIAIPSGILTFIAPVIAVQYSNKLSVVVASLLGSRLLTLSCLCFFYIKRFKGSSRLHFSYKAFLELLRFGGWMTVTNVVSPVMVNMDRLLIGSVLNLSSVTFYVTPYEIASKITYIPSAIARAFFPEFARTTASEDMRLASAVFRRAFVLTLVPLAVVCGVVAIFAGEILTVWINETFADRSKVILQILCIGIFINGISYVPFTFVQGLGRSNATAIFHLLELLLYIPCLYVLLKAYGLIGVAIAWVARASLDACLLFGFSVWKLRRN